MKGLKHWRHLLLGAEHPVTVYTNHDNLIKYHHTQKINRQVSHYLPIIAEYNIQLKHKPGASNRADALSRPPGTDEGSEDNQDVLVLPNHLFCRALDLGDLERQVYEGQRWGTFKLEEWKEKYKLLKDREMWTMNGWAVVPDNDKLRRKIMASIHDHTTAGHLGIKGTLQLVARNYWWPRMIDFVIRYVKGCARCQKTKVSTNKPKVPIYPITAEPAAKPFETIALNLIVNLPPLMGYDSILTVINHDVSKAALFFPCNQTIGALGIATIFANHVFPHFGIPCKVISNRDMHFTAQFT